MFLVIVVSVAPILAWTQNVRGAWTNVQLLLSGRMIEIRIVGEKDLIRATFVTASENTLSFRSEKATRTVERRKIQRIRVRREDEVATTPNQELIIRTVGLGYRTIYEVKH